MKKSDLVFSFMIGISIGLLCAVIIVSLKKQTTFIEDTKLETATGSSTCVFLDKEAKECIACYTWFLDYPSKDFDRISIDLIVKHTIKKYFTRHSYAEFYTFVEENTKELMAIIEDCVFAKQPIGFKLIDLTVTVLENTTYIQ